MADNVIKIRGKVPGGEEEDYTIAQLKAALGLGSAAYTAATAYQAATALMTAAQAETGTVETAMTVSAKVLHDEVARQIAALV